MTRLLLPVLVLLAAFSGGHAIASSGSASLPDGATCYLDSARRPVYPFCRGNKRNCVVTQVPSAPQAKYVGRCNSTYTRGSFCRYGGTPYAVGTKGIEGNALCKTCDCTYRRKMPGPNRAVCSCSTLPACYVDYNGQPVGKFRCPEEQNMCVITKIGGGDKDKKGLPVDKGVCVFSGIQGICGAAGPSWGPKFYMAGIEGMPKPGDRCSQCTCGATGGLLNCKRLANCKTPQSFSNAAELAIVLQNV
ncbi:unnamed protein product [Closterium sp. Yama58-4]|nr:unnamed protein product [Closterium sp. Yama58-4]